MSSAEDLSWSAERRDDQLVLGGEITDDHARPFAAALQTAGADGVVVINMAAVRAIAPASAIALQRAASYLHERGEQLVLLDTSAEVLQTLAVLGLTERPFVQVQLTGADRVS
ncbi:MAG TPA: STAS domain-containing protein [Pseudonocardia sp.]|nr:STAS domain-containing protein [Pseudonocardia sp.]